MKRVLPKLKRIVVKIGSSSLCHSNGEIDPKRIEAIVNEIASILKKYTGCPCFQRCSCCWKQSTEFKW